MKESLRISKYPLCIELFRLANESLDKTVGEPMITRRAKLHEHILDNITIFIEEDDLLCGSGASKPFGMEMQYEYGVWTKDEVESLKSEIYTITPEDEAELYELNKRFADNALNSNLVDALSKSLGMNERMWPFMKSGCILPPWKDKKGGSGGGFAMSGYGLGPGFFLVCIDFEKIIREGAKSIIEEAKRNISELRYTSADSIEKQNFWEAVIRVYEAWVRFAGRYADVAEKMAAEEKDETRKSELLEMARICRKVPYEPAESFHEAMQSFWFTFLLACPSPTTTAGRFDQYMYPYYKKDIEAGTMTDEKVLELIEIMRCKCMKINRVSGKANRAKNSGMAKWYNWTIGGVDENGNDATNELSYLLLESARDTNLPHFTVTVRVHENSPKEFLLKALQVVKTGMGMPAFLGDNSYIKFFTDGGMDLIDARDYCATGCVDGNIPAKTRSQVVTFFIIAQAFDIFMHNGYCRYTKEQVGIESGDVTKMATFDEFKQAFFRQFDYLLHLAAERNNVELIAERELFPDPFRSALMEGGVSLGKDMLDRQFDFENGSLLGAVGGVNTGDSLAAIKELVYDKRKYTMEELLKALDANWEGYDDMRQDFIAVPKYGNNEDMPDQLVAEVYKFFADTCSTMDTAYGGKVVPNAISISAHQPGGASTGATPDGRKTGEVLADASLSPDHGKDKNGPLAVLQSAMKVNQDPYQGTLLNMKFHPSALKTDDDLAKLGDVVKTYLTNGGKHVQFNVVTKEDMIDAKAHPEEHQELIVRVAGYSAYFTRLSEAIQDEVIERTSFEYA
ncbi:formate C-acetyltransferase [Youngiibacter multivorans]|uniref:Formate C-acetyltransferase n=2 Tax=Youngiibacter multivorans TaxID=937251 RepID=A0ABS4G7D3_9CLOT|nr:pyruvate formate lyase family protein [Youngiibacter multivorans]MBP1920453.1 formate C-acetyltransferase [Youngiibacter multivorans]